MARKKNAPKKIPSKTKSASTFEVNLDEVPNGRYVDHDLYRYSMFLRRWRERSMKSNLLIR